MRAETNAARYHRPVTASTPPLDGARASDDFALAERSSPLVAVIADEIAAGGGRITFERFMALALGHPQHGYYSRERLPWGADGDYETSPEVHPIFGYLWASQVAECWERLQRPEPFALVEVGAGSGRFATSLLTWLRERAPDCAAAARPVLLDGHRRRLDDQRSALEEMRLDAEHALLDEWLARPQALDGVLISNEFFDALPVHVVERRGETLHEWYVTARPDGGFAFELGDASTPALAGRFETLGVTAGRRLSRRGIAGSDRCDEDAGGALRARLPESPSITDTGRRSCTRPGGGMGTLMAFRHQAPSLTRSHRPDYST